MHFVLQTPSLQHLAGVQIVASVWSQPDILKYVPRNPREINSTRQIVPDWRKVNGSDVVESKISALPLPQRCIKQLLKFVWPLGMEIKKWCRFHKECNILFLDLLPLQLCWSMHGTVDYAKTAELIVKDERVDMKRRFEMACVNCMEDEARELFDRLVAEDRKNECLYRVRHLRRDDLSDLIPFFARSINLDVRSTFSTKCLFEATLVTGNRAMCEYLFHSFNQAEKEQILEESERLIRWCSQPLATRNLLYYISLMSEEQRRYMFRNCINDLLPCFYKWPMQSLFVDAVKCGWQFIDDQHRYVALVNIISKSIEGFEDYDYSQLFWECWALSSADYKQFFLDSPGSLCILLGTKREEFIQLVLNEGALRVSMDERVTFDAAVMEYKERAALNSSRDPDDDGKRFESKLVIRIVELVMKRRMERRGS